MATPMIKCYGKKPSNAKPKPSIVEEPKPVESYHERTDYQECYDRSREAAPDGFHELLQKVARATILARPAHVYRFIAEFLDVQLAQRTFDDIMFSCKLKKSRKLEPFPTESCILMDAFINQTPLVIQGSEQFMYGPIPDYELNLPALDRYRDYAGIDVFDMTYCELPPEPEPIKCDEDAEEEEEEEEEETCPEPPTCQGEPEPPQPEAPPPPTATQDFDKGPVPDYELAEPALDRYRDYAGIGAFELFGVEGCEDHAKPCKCQFCAMKEARSRSTSAVEPDESAKPCSAKRKDTEDDPLKTFVDSPVYREEKVEDENLHKADVDELTACEPFGDVFQQDMTFEENVFEPECPFGEEDKTFMQQHPLFGDFGTVKDKTEVIDGQTYILNESPEFPCPDHQHDPTEAGEGDAEVTEQIEPEAPPAPDSRPSAAAEPEAPPAPDTRPSAATEPEAPPAPCPRPSAAAEPEAPPAPDPRPSAAAEAEEEKAEVTEEQVADNFEGKPFEEQQPEPEPAPETFVPEEIVSPEKEEGAAPEAGPAEAPAE